MEIIGKFIAPGSQEVVKIPVGRLPSGTPIHLNAFVHRSVREGPVVLILAGVHGDEINGVEIVRRTIELGYYDKLECGSVIAIPLLNIFGFINFSRDVPDGKDVNRSFPGSKNGSLASRVAFYLSKNILPICDLVLDFHTGSKSLFNHPQIRYTKGHNASLEMARIFNAPFIIPKPGIAHSLRKYALEMGKPVLVFEGGESLRLHGLVLEYGIRGILNVLKFQKMKEGTPEYGLPSVEIERSSWQRAPRAGVFVWTKAAGSSVLKGEPIGSIGDPYGRETVRLLAKTDGYILGHNNSPVVSMGDALFHIGY